MPSKSVLFLSYLIIFIHFLSVFSLSYLTYYPPFLFTCICPFSYINYFFSPVTLLSKSILFLLYLIIFIYFLSVFASSYVSSILLCILSYLFPGYLYLVCLLSHFFTCQSLVSPSLSISRCLIYLLILLFFIF